MARDPVIDQLILAIQTQMLARDLVENRAFFFWWD